MPILGAAIGGVTSIIGGILGSNAAGNAGAALTKGSQTAATGVQNAVTSGQTGVTAGQGTATTAIDNGLYAANQTLQNTGTAQSNLYNGETGTIAGAQGGLQPYQAAGTYGINQLAATAGAFKAPTAAQAAATPGYQFQLQQGLTALQNSAAGRGLLQSGATAKGMEQYAQGLASTNYQNVFNNSLAAYNTNQAGYQSLANLGTTANSQNLQAAGLGVQAGSAYGSQLTSMAGLGTNAQLQGASMLSNAALQPAEFNATLGLQGSGMEGQYIMQGAEGTAAADIGQANAWSSALGGIANAGNTYGLSQMMPGATPTSYGTFGGYGTPNFGGNSAAAASYALGGYGY